jgi:hypothetical protein
VLDICFELTKGIHCLTCHPLVQLDPELREPVQNKLLEDAGVAHLALSNFVGVGGAAVEVHRIRDISFELG